MEYRLQSDYVPATFGERGVAIPFTTPLLSQARIRLNRDERPELIMPSLSGGKGRYVMHWEAICSVLTVTVHDRALFETLGAEVQLPELVRRAAQQVAVRGLAGTQAAEHARQSMARDRDQQLLANFCLVVRLVQQAGLSARDLIDAGVGTADTDARAKAALAEVATVLQVSKTAMVARVETLSVLIAPIGVRDAPQPGRLRQLARDLGWLADRFHEWPTLTSAEVGCLAEFMGQLATVTVALVAETIDAIDAELLNVTELLKGWDSRIGPLTRHIHRVQHLLDGWDHIIVSWQGVATKDFTTQQGMLADLFRHVPPIPRHEAQTGIDQQQIGDLAAVQRRWVRANEDWRTGRLDFDHVRRLESLKAQMP